MNKPPIITARLGTITPFAGATNESSVAPPGKGIEAAPDPLAVQRAGTTQLRRASPARWRREVATHLIGVDCGRRPILVGARQPLGAGGNAEGQQQRYTDTDFLPRFHGNRSFSWI